MTDLEEQYHLDLVLKHKASGRELTLATLQELVQTGFNTNTLQPGHHREESIPAAGFYLSGILRANGYDTFLSDKYDYNTLELIAQNDPIAVCLSTTMVLSTNSLRRLVQQIRKHLPKTCIIVGGVFVWKSYQAFQASEGNLEHTDLLFHPDSLDIDADVYVAAPHGRVSLLEVLLKIDSSAPQELDDIPNLALRSGTGFCFTKRQTEHVDYNEDITRWDLLDQLPGQIPVRTSVGCPFRCRYCDFYQLYPNIFLRSKESLVYELMLINAKLAGRPAIIHATDDNVFINTKHINVVTSAIIESGIQRWIGFMRASSINESNIKQIRNSGLLMSIIGVESGDPGQLERMNKAQKLPGVKRGIELLDKHGITVMMTFIVGYPGETTETISNTASFINSLDIGLASSSYQLYPLVISPFSDLATKKYRDQWKIQGDMDQWSHYTMDSNQARQAGYDLFRQVTNVPYHYSQERTFYNREAFTDEQRQKLFLLRHLLTQKYLEHASDSEINSVLKEIIHVIHPANEGMEISVPERIVLSG
jgi:radical SAM superfamily enzyme YgiQ (UPF0313 family)